MDLRLMGNVEIHDGTRAMPLLRAGERCVLASLAFEPGRRIHIDTLIDRLWEDNPPTGASHTIASYVRTVRKAIEEAGGKRDWLRNHRPLTYQLNIDPSLIDYHRYTALVAEAHVRQREGKPRDAVALYQEALALRSGEPLANVTGRWAANRRYAIEQEYVDAACALYEQQLAIGEYATVAIHAAELVLSVVPTDRMIVLALYGLARSGQHAGIPAFLARATQRMWDTAQARPSPRVAAVAHGLVNNPGARLPSPQIGSADGRVEEAEPPPSPSTAAGEPSPGQRVHGGLTMMTADHNQHVYQAAGDQYITEA